jgi:NTE family protein
VAETEKQDALNVLVLQGGGALGSYQAGVVEAVHDKAKYVNWAAGVSIGAINSSLIIGNPPARRVERLRAFWEIVSSGVPSPWRPSDGLHAVINQISAAMVTITGVPGFFQQHIPPRALYGAGLPGPISFYDTSPLRETLLKLVDFDLINSKKARLSVGAVEVETGNVVYFDNYKETIGPEHIMASGALPPGFPPIEIKGRHYWDGGLVSNTPLQYVLDGASDEDLSILQVDLFPARGPMPATLDEANVREKDIRYSSRTRLNTDDQVRIHRLKGSLRRLLAKLPPEFAHDPDVARLTKVSREPSIDILQLIYRSRPYESSAKDYEFSRATMLEHWMAGLEDAMRSLNHPDWTGRPHRQHGIAVYDLSHPGLERKDEA